MKSIKEIQTFIKTLRSHFNENTRLRFSIVFIVTLALAMLTYRIFFMGSNPHSDIKIVEAEKVSRHDIVQTTRLIGTIKAKRSTLLVSKGTGFLEHIAKPGEKVVKGNLIAKLDNDDLENAHKLSQHAEKIAHTQYDRLAKLHKGNISSSKELENAQNTWIEAQKSLSLAKIEYDKTRFLVPFDGIVGVYKIQDGTQVQPGTVVGTFYDPSDRIIEFDIPEPILARLGDSASIDVNNQRIKHVHIQKMINSDNNMSPAYVDYPNAGVIGSTIDLDLLVEERKDVFVIPHEAVFMKNGEQFVYLVQECKAVLTPVTLGLREKERVEIKTGLKEGDFVIIRGHSRLYPEASVKIHAPEGDAPSPSTTNSDHKNNA